jgi:CheY-like chemotaxis protein
MLLPKMAGHELLAEIRADDCLQHIPVVVLTASLVHRALLQREELHVDAFMTKPVELLKFVEVVKSLHRAMLTEFVLSIA